MSPTEGSVWRRGRGITDREGHTADSILVYFYMHRNNNNQQRPNNHHWSHIMQNWLYRCFLAIICTSSLLMNEPAVRNIHPLLLPLVPLFRMCSNTSFIYYYLLFTLIGNQYLPPGLATTLQARGWLRLTSSFQSRFFRITCDFSLKLFESTEHFRKIHPWLSSETKNWACTSRAALWFNWMIWVLHVKTSHSCIIHAHHQPRPICNTQSTVLLRQIILEIVPTVRNTDRSPLNAKAWLTHEWGSSCTCLKSHVRLLRQP